MFVINFHPLAVIVIFVVRFCHLKNTSLIIITSHVPSHRFFTQNNKPKSWCIKNCIIYLNNTRENINFAMRCKKRAGLTSSLLLFEGAANSFRKWVCSLFLFTVHLRRQLPLLGLLPTISGQKSPLAQCTSTKKSKNKILVISKPCKWYLFLHIWPGSSWCLWFLLCLWPLFPSPSSVWMHWCQGWAK